MEVDGTTGAIVELGRLAGISTPMVDLVYGLLRSARRVSIPRLASPPSAFR